MTLYCCPWPQHHNGVVVTILLTIITSCVSSGGPAHLPVCLCVCVIFSMALQLNHLTDGHKSYIDTILVKSKSQVKGQCHEVEKSWFPRLSDLSDLFQLSGLRDDVTVMWHHQVTSMGQKNYKMVWELFHCWGIFISVEVPWAGGQ